MNRSFWTNIREKERSVHGCELSRAFRYHSDIYGSRDSLLVKRRTCDRKAASSNPGRRIFFSIVNFVC